MRFRSLHALLPGQRMAALMAQFPPGARTALFTLCAPGEYERLLARVPSALSAPWASSMSPEDREAWHVYIRRTDAHNTETARKLDELSKPLSAVLAAHPYDIEQLLLLSRLLGDPVDTQGLRLYFRREALETTAGVFERVYAVNDHDELVRKIRRLQYWGAAPFVALQGIPYGEPRTNSAVQEARAIALDWDTKHGQFPPYAELEKYPPSLFVKTGGGYHAYWIIPKNERRGLTLEHWRRVNLALCRTLNSDLNAALGTQLMRLPGSVHLKDRTAPHPVQVVATHLEPRTDVLNTLCSTFSLELRDESFNTLRGASSVDMDPDDHPALARILEELEMQQLHPTPVNQGWAFYCPVHEISAHDDEEGFVPRASSTPSGVLRVNSDLSLSFFCGSTQKCGAGPRVLLERLALDPGLPWLECGGFLNSTYGKRFKAARIADGTWTDRVPSELRDAWDKATGL